MKPVVNTPKGIIPTTGIDVCDHQSRCRPTDRCWICGRRVCSGCISSKELRRTGVVMCLICARQYTPDAIKLHDD